LHRQTREPPNQTFVDSKAAFYFCFLSNTLAAAYAPIQDCDEVFNYWEPTHYLSHGYGLQTWEYSPDYAIRSWLYIAIHATIGKFGSVLSRTKTAEFYFIRLVLAVVCAGCEARLFSALSRTLNPRIGILFLVIMAFSPGMLHASVALLPSSFAMYTSMLGLTSFMDWYGGSQIATGIMWFGIGSIVGWPFASALILPFILEELVLAALAREVVEVTRRFLDGIVRSMIVLVGYYFHRSDIC
jgi:alpha-1,2-mannosyltransferase